MLDASTEFDTAINQHFRNRGYVKVVLGAVNVTAQAAASVDKDASEAAYWSSTDIFNFKTVKYSYATTEEDVSLVDGSMYFLPEEDSGEEYCFNGWVSANLVSEGDCSLTINFSETVTFNDLTITFGTPFPTEFTITTDNGELTCTVDDVEAAIENTDDIFTSISGFTITPTTMSGGSTNVRFKVTGIAFGKIYNYTNDNITSTDETDCVSPITDSIPSYDLTINISDYDLFAQIENGENIVDELIINQPVFIWHGYDIGDGEIEWLDSMKLYLSSWSVTYNTITLIATDYFENHMSGSYVYGEVSEHTLYELAEQVFSDAGETEYTITDTLKNYTTNNPILNVAYKEALQEIANAGHCILAQLRDGTPAILDSYIDELESCAVEDYVAGDGEYIITNDSMTAYPGLTLETQKSEVDVVYTQYNYTTPSKTLGNTLSGSIHYNVAQSDTSSTLSWNMAFETTFSQPTKIQTTDREAQTDGTTTSLSGSSTRTTYGIYGKNAKFFLTTSEDSLDHGTTATVTYTSQTCDILSEGLELSVSGVEFNYASSSNLSTGNYFYATDMDELDTMISEGIAKYNSDVIQYDTSTSNSCVSKIDVSAYAGDYIGVSGYQFVKSNILAMVTDSDGYILQYLSPSIVASYGGFYYRQGDGRREQPPQGIWLDENAAYIYINGYVASSGGTYQSSRLWARYSPGMVSFCPDELEVTLETGAKVFNLDVTSLSTDDYSDVIPYFLVRAEELDETSDNMFVHKFRFAFSDIIYGQAHWEGSTGAYSYVQLTSDDTITMSVDVDGKAYATTTGTYVETTGDSGDALEWTNALISTEEEAKSLAEWLAYYYGSEIEYNITWRGDPRTEPIDKFMVLSQDGTKYIATYCYQNELVFNGAWSGTLKLVKAND